VASADEIAELLSRMPDLSNELRNAPLQLKRQVFEAFELRVAYDKLEGRIEISATVSEAIIQAFRTTEPSLRRAPGASVATSR
jgi:hypothetical protein